MLSTGIQRTLARVSSASATQVLACAAATISGRASESRRAVARLIGNRKSVGANGVACSLGRVARGDGAVTGPPGPGVGGRRGGKAGAKSRTTCSARASTAGGTIDGCTGDGNTGGCAAQRKGSTQESSKAARSIHAQ